MKTTVELPEDLYMEAKKRAAKLHRPLRALIEEALRSQLSWHSEPGARERKKIKWVTVEGGIPPGLDIASREKMHEWLRRPG